jgi:hypothetical protein
MVLCDSVECTILEAKCGKKGLVCDVGNRERWEEKGWYDGTKHYAKLQLGHYAKLPLFTNNSTWTFFQNFGTWKGIFVLEHYQTLLDR